MSSVKAWTDYPFTWAGDVEGEQAPVREAVVLSYDGDKYCEVFIPDFGEWVQIKSGYLYSEAGRYGEVPTLSREVLTELYNLTFQDKGV